MPDVQSIITEVRRTIHDEADLPYRWSDIELIDYVNAGHRSVVSLIPEANTIESVGDTLTSRVAKQSLPAGGIKFIKVARNYADDGTTPQGVVRYTEKDALDTFDPAWEYVSTKADGANYFEHFCHEDREPTVFYLYPVPVLDNKRFALVYSAVPTILTAVENDLPLADVYINALVQYTVYRALTKESRESLPDAFRSDLWQNYLVALGLKKEAEANVSPTTANRAPDGD